MHENLGDCHSLSWYFAHLGSTLSLSLYVLSFCCRGGVEGMPIP